MFYMIFSYVFIFLMYDIMNFLNGKSTSLLTINTWYIFSNVFLGCMVFYLIFYKLVKIT